MPGSQSSTCACEGVGKARMISLKNHKIQACQSWSPTECSDVPVHGCRAGGEADVVLFQLVKEKHCSVRV